MSVQARWTKTSSRYQEAKPCSTVSQTQAAYSLSVAQGPEYYDVEQNHCCTWSVHKSAITGLRVLASKTSGNEGTQQSIHLGYYSTPNDRKRHRLDRAFEDRS